MQEKVHAQEGKDYDAGRVDPARRPSPTRSSHVLDLGDDATVPDLSIKPR